MCRVHVCVHDCVRAFAIVRALKVERDALSRGSMFLISGRPVARTGYYRDTPTRAKPLRGFLRSTCCARSRTRWKKVDDRGEKDGSVYTVASN